MPLSTHNITISRAGVWSRRVRCGVHLLPTDIKKYIYIWENSHSTSTEGWQKTLHFQEGQKTPMKLSRTKEKRERYGNHDRTCASETKLWKRKGFCTLNSPTDGEMGLKRGGSLEPLRRRQQQACRRQSRERPAHKVSAKWHSSAWDSCPLTQWGRWGPWYWSSGIGGQTLERGLGLPMRR